MFPTPFLRRQMLDVIEHHLLPWARAGNAPGAENASGAGADEARRLLLLLESPLRLPPDVPVEDRVVDASLMRRGKPAPGRGSFTAHIMWPHLGLQSIPFAWLGFLFQGQADLRIGASRTLRAKAEVEGRIHVVSLRAPAFFVIPPGVPHPDGSRIPWERPLSLLHDTQRMFWIHVSPAGLRCHLSRVAGHSYQEEFFLLLKTPALLALAGLLLSEMQRPQRFDLVVEAVLLCLLLEMQTTLGAESTPRPGDFEPELFSLRPDQRALQTPAPVSAQAKANSASTNNILMAAALRFIETHLNWRPLSLEMVAAHAHVSPSHLNRLFKAHLHMTVRAYIQHNRLELARALLTQSEMPIAEVGFLVGFFPPSHFARVFLQATGTSPRAFRDAQREEFPDASTDQIPARRPKKRGP